MTKPEPIDMFAAIDATWPAHRIWQSDGWTFREGRGGGKRVSSTTLAASLGAVDVAVASQTMRDMGQSDLFMIRPQDAALDHTLNTLGFEVLDPVVLLRAQIDTLPMHPPVHAAVWRDAPDAAMTGLWALGGIEAGRLDIIRRCELPRANVMLSVDGLPVATAFVAAFKTLAMAHAVEVLKEHRGKGYGKDIMRAVLDWSRNQGATEFGIITTAENTVALSLYRGLGLVDVGQYHYRIKRGLAQ
jgi:GNAT superfamily N-acetyltransferase